ncbi:MAG: hypothetical protein JO242_27045 [Streptosporangiaceae bacterium]|nr:hypothetical protein [Streptosporangiaceae bacterium]
MAGFVLGVVSSLAATALTVVVGWIGSKRMRHWPVAALSKVTGLGILRSYPQQKLANLDLSTDLASARWVKVLTGRGNELTRDSFRQTWEEADSRLECVQILLPDPDPGAASFLAARETEIRRYDAGYRTGLLSEQIRSNIGYISTVASKRHHIKLRVFDFQQVCRVVVTDRVAYFTTYSGSDHGRNCPCIVFGNAGPLYDFALRMFNVTWERAIPVSNRRS